MKIVKIALISIVVLLAVVIAAVWACVKFIDVNPYIPQITDAVNKATGRQLTIAQAGMDFTFTQGLVLDLKGIALSDDPKFSGSSFLKIASIKLAVDAKEAVLSKKIVVSNITIEAPDITIISAKDGSINAAGIGAGAGKQSVSEPAVKAGGSNPPAMPALLVRDILVKAGKVHYVNHISEPAMAVDVTDINISVRNFSLTEKFDFLMTSAVLANEPNTTVSGSVLLDLAKTEARVSNVKIEIQPDKILPAHLNNAVPSARSLGFKKAGGSLKVVVGDMLAGGKGLESLDAQVTLQLNDVVLEGGNILASALNSIPMLPGLMDTVLPVLPAETQADIQKGITAINSLEVQAKADKSAVAILKAEVVTREASISATGKVELAGGMDIAASLIVSQNISSILVSKVSDLNGLVNEGSISIPVKIRGALTKPGVSPDLDYIGKRLLVNRGNKELQKVLGDPAVGKAVGDVLNSFFKK